MALETLYLKCAFNPTRPERPPEHSYSGGLSGGDISRGLLLTEPQAIFGGVEKPVDHDPHVVRVLIVLCKSPVYIFPALSDAYNSRGCLVAYGRRGVFGYAAMAKGRVKMVFVSGV
jgi:hypothetical protein